MDKKVQVVFIHGGDAFRDPEKLYTSLRERSVAPLGQEQKRWREDIIEKLSDTFEFQTPKMPNPQWADYTAWQIWFEKHISFFRDDVVLVGHSLGGGFLLRYLSENKLPVRVGQLHSVAGVVDERDLEDVDGFTINLAQWSGFKTEIMAGHLWYSSDDPYVPLHHGERLVAAWPPATLHTFTDRGHFLQPEFPELLAEIQKRNR